MFWRVGEVRHDTTSAAAVACYSITTSYYCAGVCNTTSSNNETVVQQDNRNILTINNREICGSGGSGQFGFHPHSFPRAFFLSLFNLTYSRWTSSLPSCLWSQRIFPSLPGSRLTFFFYRDASSALLQLVNQWLNFTYSRSHAFRYERENTNPTLVRIELTTSALLIAGVQITY